MANILNILKITEFYILNIFVEIIYHSNKLKNTFLFFESPISFTFLYFNKQAYLNKNINVKTIGTHITYILLTCASFAFEICKIIDILFQKRCLRLDFSMFKICLLLVHVFHLIVTMNIFKRES